MENNLLKFIWRYSRKQQIFITLLTIAYFPILYLMLELPKIIVNEVLQKPNETHSILQWSLTAAHFLVFLCLAFLFLVFVNGLIKMGLNTYKGIIGERMIRRLRFQLIDRILRFPVQRFNKLSQGEIISMVTGESEPLAGYVSDAIALPIFQGGTMLTILIFMFAQDFQLGLAAITLIPVQAYIIPKLQRKINQLKKTRVRHMRKFSERIGETSTGAAAIRVHGTQRYTLAEFSSRLNDLFFIRLEIYKKKYFMKFLNNTIGQMTPFMFYLFGGFLVINGELSLGALVAVIAAYKDLTSPWKELLNYYQTQQDARIRYEQIIEVFNEGDIYDADFNYQNEYKRGQFSLPIKATQLATKNDLNQVVLSGVNFKIKSGSNCLFISDSAFFRNHLAELLIGIRPISQGNLTLGSDNYFELLKTGLNRHLGYQPVSPVIFNSSIFDNIMYGINNTPSDSNKDPQYYKEAFESGNSIDDFHLCWRDYEFLGVENESQLRDWFLQVNQASLSDKLMYNRSLMEYVDSEKRPELTTALINLRPEIIKEINHKELNSAIDFFDMDEYLDQLTVAENLVFSLSQSDSAHTDLLLSHPDFCAQIFDDKNFLHQLLEIGLKLFSRLLKELRVGETRYEVMSQFHIQDELQVSEFERFALKIRKVDVDEFTKEEQSRVLKYILMLKANYLRTPWLSDEIKQAIIQKRHLLSKHDLTLIRSDYHYICHESYCPNLTVMENLIYGQIKPRQATEAQKQKISTIVRDYLEKHHLIGDVSILMTEQTSAGISGSRITGVGRQSIPWARSIIKRPDIMIVNDGLNAMQSKDQLEILQNTRKLLPDMTIIWISPREIEFADQFDQVIDLDK